MGSLYIIERKLVPDDDKCTAALELAAILLDWEHKQSALTPRAEALRGSYWKKMAEKTIGPRLESMLANADAARVQLRADIKGVAGQLAIAAGEYGHHSGRNRNPTG
ncbi:hypothetical protein AGMMS50256_17980 [Betaproteobacteria bacterium]|nr:hypothetical protein AGMMS50256_17980 [Betaproteobacteria bacterium]